MTKSMRLALLTAGLALFFWFIQRTGWEAINNVIPTLYVGGEAAKVFLLKRHGVSKLTATSAAVRSKTAQSVAQSSFIALGALVAVVILPPEQATIKWIFAEIALAGFGVMGVLLRIQRHGMVNTGWVDSEARFYSGFRHDSLRENQGAG